jgi:hypothetical protein
MASPFILLIHADYPQWRMTRLLGLQQEIRRMPRLQQYYIYSSGKSCAMYIPLTIAWQIPDVELRSKNIRLAQAHCNRVSTYLALRFKVMGVGRSVADRYCGGATPEYQVILIADNRD